MAKTSVSDKMLELSGLYLRRMNQRLGEDSPTIAIFWATMIHGLFGLAGGMAADGQMHPEVFVELNKREQRALAILRRVGPLGSSLEGTTPSEINAVLAAYEEFREEAEMLGVV